MGTHKCWIIQYVLFNTITNNTWMGMCQMLVLHNPFYIYSALNENKIIFRCSLIWLHVWLSQPAGIDSSYNGLHRSYHLRINKCIYRLPSISEDFHFTTHKANTLFNQKHFKMIIQKWFNINQFSNIFLINSDHFILKQFMLYCFLIILKLMQD